MALLGCLVIVVIGWAQTGAGNIQGTVRDSTGGMVPGAKISLVHTATARQYTTQTNGVGFFLFPSVQIGAYEISVEAPGMEVWTGQLTLLAGQTAEVETVLRTGSTSTKMEVSGDITPLVTTTAATLATVVETERIQQLPIDGRSITTLLYMTTPGVLSDPNGFMPRVYGLRNASEMMEDGAIMQNGEWGGMPYRQPGRPSATTLVTTSPRAISLS